MGRDTTFAGKFLQKIKKVDTEQLEQFLGQILKEKTFLEAIYDSLTEGVLVAEQGSRIVFVNEAARKLLGLGSNDKFDRPLREVLRDPSLRALVDEFNESTEPIRQREIRVKHPRSATYSLTVVPIENDDALATHSVWIIGDRTEIRRQQAEQARLENMEAMATLTAGVAHEVKNPLNSLNIHAQLLSREAEKLAELGVDETASERMRRSSQVMLEEIGRLTRIVDDFINAVRPVRLTLRREPINAIISSLAELTGPDCASRGIELILDLDPENPQLLLDSQQISQALLNILKNAIEAIDKEDGFIKLCTRLRSDHVLVEVHDNGCGIPEADKLKIFEPYHTTKFEGTGLGLMVVFRIIRAHNGAVGIQSREGEGTVFSLALPIDERPIRLLSSQVEPPLEVPENDG
ncbi:MAG: PAS domain-containing protein [Candidatus Sumerlaeia bacterium]|nr:PAS domain-containing protein [Candidatus Sumerlaeia bacterium]